MTDLPLGKISFGRKLGPRVGRIFRGLRAFSWGTWGALEDTLKSVIGVVVVVVVVSTGIRGRKVTRMGWISLGISVITSCVSLMGMGSGASVWELRVTSFTVAGCVSVRRGMDEEEYCSGEYVSVVSVFGVIVESSSSTSCSSSGDTEVLRLKAGRMRGTGAFVVVVVVVTGIGTVVGISFSVDSSSKSSFSSIVVS